MGTMHFNEQVGTACGRNTTSTVTVKKQNVWVRMLVGKSMSWGFVEYLFFPIVLVKQEMRTSPETGDEAEALEVSEEKKIYEIIRQGQ